MISPKNTATPSTEPKLGENLKHLRQQLGWSVLKLSEVSGLPQSTLSKVENGQMSLNFDKLIQVAKALGIEVQSLFETASERENSNVAMARRVIDRNQDMDLKEVDHYKIKFLSTELKNRLMLPLLFEVGDNHSNNTQLPMMDVIGERFAYVVEGPVDFHCEHYETVTLSSGDSIYVDASMPHAFVAPEGETAKVITVLSSDDQHYLQLAREASLKGNPDVSNNLPRHKNKR